MSRALIVAVALLLSLSGGLQSQDARIDSLFQAAVSAQQHGDFLAAKNGYEQILNLQPGLVTARANLGAVLVHLNRFGEAIAEYQIALKADPQNPAIRLNLALAFYKNAAFAKAVPVLEALVRSGDADARVETLLGDCYLQTGKNAQAIATLSPLAQQNPSDLDVAHSLGTALLRSGQVTAGVNLLEQVGKQGNSGDSYLAAGESLLKDTQCQRALSDLNLAERLNPKLSGLHVSLGVAKECAGDKEGAISDLKFAVAENANDFDANVHLAGVLYASRDLPQARRYAQRALQLKPSSPFVLYEIALIDTASGDGAKAVTIFEQLEKNDPGWLDVHVQLSTLYYKLHRTSDGMRERQTVARLTEQQQTRDSKNPQPAH